MKGGRVLTVLVYATVALALTIGACGAGDDGGAETTTTGPATDTSERNIDEALLGVWVNEQGIQLEFTADGVVTLTYEGSQAQSIYSAEDGVVSYTDFEPNEAGVLPLVAVQYLIDGDTLLWDVGGRGELTLTRK